MAREISFKCKRCGCNSVAMKGVAFVTDKDGNFICGKCLKEDWHLQVSLAIKPKTYSAFIPFSEIETRVLSKLDSSDVRRLKSGISSMKSWQLVDSSVSPPPISNSSTPTD